MVYLNSVEIFPPETLALNHDVVIILNVFIKIYLTKKQRLLRTVIIIVKNFGLCWKIKNSM